MGIVEKLKDLGIKPGQLADILLDSGKQFQLIKDYGIDTKENKFRQFRCIISPNAGNRKYSSPVLAHSRKSRLPASSLQLGIFNLLYFDRVLPLNPIERHNPKSSFELKLFRVSDDKFDLTDLVRRYNLHKVYFNFLSLGEDDKKSRTKLICGYESLTYQKFLNVQKVV